MEVNEICVHVKTTSSFVTIQTQLTESVYRFKTLVHEKTSTSHNGYELVYNGVCLRTGNLKENGIENNCIIFLCLFKTVNVFYIQPEKSDTFMLDSKDVITVDQLKERLQTVNKIPKEQQRLMFEGMHMVSGDLDGFGVKNESTIKLIVLNGKGDLKLSICHISSNEPVQLKADSSDTVDRLKLSIAEKVDIPMNSIRLSYAGKDLVNGTSTLEEYKIDSEVTIYWK